MKDGEYFDRLVRDTGDFNPFADRGWRTLGRRFAAVVPAGARLQVLDVGCGTGQSRRIYAPFAERYVGVDLSLEALSIARRRDPSTNVLQADALRLPIADACMDLVAFSSVLHHVGDRPRALSEARRVLRPGGLVFAFDPNVRHPAMLMFRHPASPFYRREGVSPNEQPLSPPALALEFAAAGFSGVGQRCVSDIPYRQVAVGGFNALLGAYNRADWLWEKSGLGRWFGSFVVTWGLRVDR